MANEKISQLPAVVNATLADVIYAIQSGTSSQETLQQVYNLFSSNVILHFAGNPNGNVAGTQYQTFCWDTTDNFLWICTVTGSTSAAVWKPIIGALTNGQLAIGSTSASPVAATLTAGTNISVTNGAGSITIATTGVGSFTWTRVTGTSQTMASNNGYIADNSSLITFTLPASSALGDELQVVGRGSGGWTIVYGTSQQILFGSSSTTLSSGSLSSTNAHDSVALVCTKANIEWTVSVAPQGILTVV